MCFVHESTELAGLSWEACLCPLCPPSGLLDYTSVVKLHKKVYSQGWEVILAGRLRIQRGTSAECFGSSSLSFLGFLTAWQ